MKGVAWAILTLCALTFVALVGSWVLGLWTGDERWGYTGVLLIIPLVATAALGGATMGAAYADD